MDVVQDTFIKAYTNLRSFNSKYKFSSWIYRIAHNESINTLKKIKKNISLENNQWVEQIAGNEKSADKMIEEEEVKISLQKYLSMLPAKYQEVLVLFYLEEKSYEEISDILRISTGTVGTWISRAKKELKTRYTKREEE